MKVQSPKSKVQSGQAAFTLLEVMIASGILFMSLFAILQLLSTSLRNARVLQRTVVDAGMPAAELSLTNKLWEGPVPKGLGGFEKMYPDYRYEGVITQVGTNGLFQVDYIVYRRTGDHGTESRLSILLFRPESTKVGRLQ